MPHPFDTIALPNGAQLILTPCPGTKEVGLADSIAQLKNAGAQALITLLSTAELTALNVANLGAEVAAQGLQWFQLPVEDDHAPTPDFLAEFARVKPQLLALLNNGAGVVMHCRGGTGRTGVMGALLMLELGYEWDDLKARIQAVRPKVLTIAAQLDFLTQYRTAQNPSDGKDIDTKINTADMPNIDPECIKPMDIERLFERPNLTHKPRILLLYGSLRERSFSRLVTEECARILQALGAETKTFNPTGLPLPDSTDDQHPKVQELRDLATWAEGMVWCSPERHGAMTGIMKLQIDWLPLAIAGVRPTQGKTLAVMQVSGGSQSFNAVNQLRVLGRWMRMLTIPNQSSVAKAFMEFDDAGRMKPSAYYDRVVDVMEELVKFTLLTRDVSPYLVDRYSERKESAEALIKRVSLKAI